MLNSCLQKAAFFGLLLSLTGCNFGFLSFSEKTDPNGPGGTQKTILPKTLNFLSADTAEVGMCFPVEVTAVDDKGKETAVAGDELLSLSIQGGSVSLFSDNLCTLMASSITLAKGQSRSTFYLKPMANIAFTLVALSQKLGYNSKFLTPFRKARQMVFLAQPADTEGGYCGGGISVQIQDALGDAIAYTGSLPITGLGNGNAYDGNACAGSPITSLTFNNEDTKTFTLKNMTIQAMTPKVDAPVAAGATLVGSLSKSILNKSAPYDLFMDQIPTGLILGDFSATGAQVRVKDSSGAFLTSLSAALTVTVTKMGTDTAEFKEVGTTTAVTSLPLTLSGTTIGKSFLVRPTGTTIPPTVAFQATATYRGRSLSANSGGAALSVSRVARGVKLSNASSASGPITLGAGVCSPAFSVSLLDGINVVLAPSADTTVNLDPDASGTFSFYSDNRCANAIASNSVTIPNGISSATFYFKDTKDDANAARDLSATASTFTSSNYRVNVARLPLQTETTFGTAGTRDFSIDNGFDVVSAMTPSSAGGKYILVGRSKATSGSNLRLSAAVVDSNGTLDSSFSGNGKYTASLSCTEARGNAVLSVSDGYLIAGKCDGNMLLHKISLAGAAVSAESTSFSGATVEGFAVANAPSGNSFLYSAGLSNTGGTNGIAIVRYTSSGVKDVAGIVNLTALGNPSVVNVKGMVVQRVSTGPDVDKLVVLVTLNSGGSSGNDMALCRISDSVVPADSSDTEPFDLDSSFGTNGCQMIDSSGRNDTAAALLPISSGFLLVGTTAQGSSQSGFLLAELDNNGGPTSFGTKTHFSGSTLLEAGAVAVYPNANDEILVGGSQKASSGADANWYVARFKSNGALDNTISSPAGNNVRAFANGATDSLVPESVAGIAIGTNHMPVLAGTVGPNQRVMRVLY